MFILLMAEALITNSFESARARHLTKIPTKQPT